MRKPLLLLLLQAIMTLLLKRILDAFQQNKFSPLRGSAINKTTREEENNMWDKLHRLSPSPVGSNEEHDDNDQNSIYNI
jgi:hypothetical protein